MLIAPQPNPPSEQEIINWPDSSPAPSKAFATMRLNLSKSRTMLSRGTAEKELSELERKVVDVVEALDRLSEPALHALNHQSTAMRKLKTGLRILAAAATSADVSHLPDRFLGAPTKPQANRIAEYVGVQYFFRTGKKPSKTQKPFVTLLGAVYDALEFCRSTERGAARDRVSAYSQAKALNDKWEAVTKKHGIGSRGQLVGRKLAT
jgi:hypothetical protein